MPRASYQFKAPSAIGARGGSTEACLTKGRYTRRAVGTQTVPWISPSLGPMLGDKQGIALILASRMYALPVV